jgi:hypothetical protein
MPFIIQRAAMKRSLFTGCFFYAFHPKKKCFRTNSGTYENTHLFLQ